MVNDPGSILIFDRTRLRQNRRRGRAAPDDHRFLQNWALQQLGDRLTDVARDFPLALQMGAGAGVAHAKIGRSLTVDALRGDVIGDEEFLPFGDASFDLVLSTLNLHSVNDLPGSLLQIRRALKPDGLFLAALFGGETLHELRASLMQAELEIKGGASPRVFPFADKPQMGALLQRAGFALPVVDSEIVTVTYENMFGLLHDLRYMGEGNIIAGRHKANPGKALFLRAAEYYRDTYAEADGRLRATFEVIFLIGWAPHASQQRPLRPGSAQTRLADALGAAEIKTGQKAQP